MPRRILVADDMEINRNHLSKILHSDGFRSRDSRWRSVGVE